MTTVDAQQSGERGVALVLVVSILAVVSVMVTHMVVVSRISSVESKVLRDRHFLRHDAESAAEWAYWMYVSDRRKFPTDHRDLLTDAALTEGRSGQSPWLADGRSHTLLTPSAEARTFREAGRGADPDGPTRQSTVTVRITDANNGYSLAGNNPGTDIRKTFQNLEENEEMRALLDRLADYVDTDPNTRLDGLEQPEYEGLGAPSLPRDKPMEFRAEVLWIPGVLEAFSRGQGSGTLGSGALDLFHPIPPPGRSMPASKKPSIFAAHANLIRQKLDIGLGQAEAVLKALRRAQAENLPLDTVLTPDLVQQVRRHFSTGESGIVIIAATATTPGGTNRTHRVMRDCSQKIGQVSQRFRYIDSWHTWIQ